MTIQYEDLITILRGRDYGDVEPGAALYIRFSSEPSRVKQTITFDACDTRSIHLDIGEDDTVVGIEFF